MFKFLFNRLPKVEEIYCIEGESRNPYRIVTLVKNRIIHYKWLIYDEETHTVYETTQSNIVIPFLFNQLFSKSFSNKSEFENYFNVTIQKEPSDISSDELF
ncbi:hypothetical protein EBR43_07280 [bacterium]|nr:hypothetical protein [bacterium]